ncbi:ornithine cyclodeaminase family protein [Kribbella sp. NPDC056345]|uniref:ornithine cyclodeaminase family protein n=1 Tax=Kribbella sp. NPDC056345 TaxID=3345789 RepID=UPI0035DFB86D
MTLPVFGIDIISEVATPAVVFDAVRSALIAHADGRTSVPAPMVLEFPQYAGDTHVKAGHVAGAPYFVVKVASTFGSVNNGLVLAVDATNGQPAAVLADEGKLTAWRTAAAGALITDAMTPVGVDEVAVLGTGEQALLQVLWLRELRPLRRVKVWGRRPEAVERLCTQLRAADLHATPDGLSGAPCVITTTAAREPLPLEAFHAAVHITGIGTDMPGKGELPPEVFAGAFVATDDHVQCLHHGDFGNAVRAGVIDPDHDVPVGAVLRDGMPRHQQSVADLTGVGATDAAVAGAVLSQLVR